MGGVLSGAQLRTRIEAVEPLIEGWSDLEAQIQPNGFDLTVQRISRFAGAGAIGRDNAGRVLAPLDELEFDVDGWLTLPAGPYQLVFNEVVRLPLDVMALGRPRSSLARSAVAIHSAVWDAGYHGRSTSLLIVSNPAGFRVARGARLLQLVFFRLDETAAMGYAGTYQGENLTTPPP